MLAQLLAEQDRYEESLRTLERFEALSPLLDRRGRQWLAAQRSDILYERGDFEGARRQATLARSGFHHAVLDCVARTNGTARRVTLRVPFVKQRHKTCTPASLAALSRYWHKPLDQDDLADAMSYDGTPHHAVLTWGRANGWVARDFRVTWESARTLLDRGIPFAISTTGTAGGHQQVVAGYDARRGTFKVRCPSQPFLLEFLAEPMLEQQKWAGPMGVVWLPAEDAGRLADIALPDVANHDDMHALQVALLAHERAAAGEVLRSMEGRAPASPLTFWARHLLAAYDGDLDGMLGAIDALLERFPDVVRLHLARLSLLEALSPFETYALALTEVFERHRNDPAVVELWLRHQQPRSSRPARRMLRAVLRRQPEPSAALLFVLATQLDADGQPKVAEEIGRFAACLEERDEALAWGYFATMQARGVPDEGLGFLRKRFEAHGRASSGPGLTLVWALETLDRHDEAATALDRALSMRPRDTDLRLSAADAYARRGDFARADQLLAGTRGCTRRASWLRIAAAVAGRRNDQVEALRLWRLVLEGEPWAADANLALASLLAAAQGRDVGASHLASALARYPHHQDLQRASDAWARQTEEIARRQSESQNAGNDPIAKWGGAWYPLLFFLLLQMMGRSCG
jgi:tetratricopeptide (TPR) repeat protein